MDEWPLAPLYMSLNHGMAIRQFCAARLEQEQQGGDLNDALNEIDMWSSSDTNSPSLGVAEQEEFVDSFINMDSYEDDNHNLDQGHQLGGFTSKFEAVSMPNCYEVVSMLDGEEFDMISEPGFSHKELGMVPGVFTACEGEVTEATQGIDEGLHLVHLLLSCAEAVGCRDSQLASSMLSKIWASANPWGDPLQRVSYCFAMGLKIRLSLLHNVGTIGSSTNVSKDVRLISKEERMEGFHLLYQTTPYVAFGFMAANEAICQASQGKEALHILDLGMEYALQWSSLIRNLASRPEGPPTLRITWIGVGSNLVDLEASMKVLASDASSRGISLEFRAIVEPPSPTLLSIENLELREGEALFVNSIMHLHRYVKESRGSLKSILHAIRRLNPTLFTIVEQDANHNGPFFLGRFLESLHYYSAIFDSLEATLPRPSHQRMKIETTHFAEEICNIVAYEGMDRVERHERADQWRRQLGRAGFQAVGLKSMSQARMMLSVYGCDGYTLASEKGCLLLGWKGRPIMLASAWKVHPTSSS